MNDVHSFIGTPGGLIDPDATARAIDAVAGERSRQDRKWGLQDHPSLDPVILARAHGPADRIPERMAQEYEIPSEARAKFLCSAAAEKSQLTFAHILVEEVAEAIACLRDEQAMRGELIQVAAVAIAWIEAIDRRAGAGNAATHADACQLPDRVAEQDA